MYNYKKATKTDKISWPILIVSDLFSLKRDEGYRLNNLVECLEGEHGCRVTECLSYEDGRDVFASRADFGTVIIDWDMPHSATDPDARELLKFIRSKNTNIPIFLFTDKAKAENLDSDIINMLSGTLWKTSDTVEFLAGIVEKRLSDYIATLHSPFFGALVKYAEEYKYAWHTPGHMGGTGFLRTPSGTAFFKYFGENMFRNDLSVSVPELGSLLDHSGVTGDAERNSARVFGADQTYYVLNGTSNVNQIIWRSQVSKDDIALVDRNCHKSLNYAMVITEAYPVYMVPRRNKMGIIGPVRLKEFEPETIECNVGRNALIPESLKGEKIKMAALTNSTYDGICYNILRIKEKLGGKVENLHFDEAWFAYARFFPIYAGYYGMSDGDIKEEHPPIFVSQSTHKLLTAFSQSSMLHIKNGGKVKIDPAEFNESYMMHASTSPQYNMVASLDVATKMMDESGEHVWGETITLAVEFRKSMVKIRKDLEKKGDWFFGMWQPEFANIGGKKLPFEDVDTETLVNSQKPWVLDSRNNWHGFDGIEDSYAMLDPIKLTITTPGFDVRGSLPNSGIPAAVVTNFLMEEGIVCEKTDFYSFLMLHSLGTNRAKQESLLMALMKFKKLYDTNAPMEDVFPEMAEKSRGAYSGKGLRDHCRELHEFIKKSKILEKMQKAFETLPKQAMKPSDAYRQLVKKNAEFVPLSHMRGRIPAVMVVPYPPGIPIIMGGEIIDSKNSPVFDYLSMRETFENLFPGYEGDIHGVERFEKDNRIQFKILCIKRQPSGAEMHIANARKFSRQSAPGPGPSKKL